MLGRTCGRVLAQFVDEGGATAAAPRLLRHLDPLPHASHYGHVPAQWVRTRALFGPRIPLYILVTPCLLPYKSCTLKPHEVWRELFLSIIYIKSYLKQAEGGSEQFTNAYQ